MVQVSGELPDASYSLLNIHSPKICSPVHLYPHHISVLVHRYLVYLPKVYFYISVLCIFTERFLHVAFKFCAIASWKLEVLKIGFHLVHISYQTFIR